MKSIDVGNFYVRYAMTAWIVSHQASKHGQKGLQLYIEEVEVEDHPTLISEEVSAVSLVCCNCKKSNHRYQEIIARLFDTGAGP